MSTIAERYLAFKPSNVVSSAEFTTEFLTYTPNTSQTTFSQGDSFTISLSNLNKAQFALPDSSSLIFDVIISTKGQAVNNADFRQRVSDTPDDAPRPYFGCPYFEAVSATVPGSASFDAMPASASQTAAYWYSTRLLASSVCAQSPYDRGAELSLPGRYRLAGGKSGYERAGCVSGSVSVGTAAATNTPREARGTSMSMSVPLSAVCSLYAKSSSLIPLGMLSSGGDSLVFTFTVARNLQDIIGTAVGDGVAASKGFSEIKVSIINPRIVCGIVRVQNPRIVSQISSLYDGRVTVAIPSPVPNMKPTQITVPMVVKHKSFQWASTIIPAQLGSAANSSSNFSLTFSGVNQPSVSAIVLRFRYRPNDGSPDSKLRRSKSSVFLGADEPRLIVKRLVATLNDLQQPLGGISDLGETKVATYDDTTGVATGFLGAQTSSGQASGMFELGRHGLGFYMEEDHGTSLADVVFDKSVLDTTSLSSTVAVPAAGTLPATVLGPVYNAPKPFASFSESSAQIKCYKRPIALFVIPLCSMPQLVGDYSDAHTLRSWDMRSVSSFSVSAQVQTLDDVVGSDSFSKLLRAPVEDIICDGALVCDSMLRLAAGSSDSRYVYTAVAEATVASG